MAKNAKPKPTLIKLDLSYDDMPAGDPFTRIPGIVTKSGLDTNIAGKWALRDASVEEARSLYLFQRLSANQRLAMMEELWRVLIPGGKVLVLAPYYASSRAVQDPLAVWPPVCEATFLYFNRKYRDDNKTLPFLKCNFEFVYGYQFDPETATRPDDTKPFWMKHYLNSALDVHVTLTRLD